MLESVASCMVQSDEGFPCYQIRLSFYGVGKGKRKVSYHTMPMFRGPKPQGLAIEGLALAGPAEAVEAVNAQFEACVGPARALLATYKSVSKASLALTEYKQEEFSRIETIMPVNTMRLKMEGEAL